MQYDQQAQRQAWIDGLTQLREQGAITVDDESTLIRHMDERLEAVQLELAALVPEYNERVASDGQPAADAWIGERAREMGEREGADARRIVESLASVKDAAA